MNDCRRTTVSSADLGVLVGTSAAQIAASVNTGFDLSDKDDGKCGASLVKLAAKKCKALLLAEGKFVAGISKDPGGVKRAEKLSKATLKLGDGWAKVLAKGERHDQQQPAVHRVRPRHRRSSKTRHCPMRLWRTKIHRMLPRVASFALPPRRR